LWAVLESFSFVGCYAILSLLLQVLAESPYEAEEGRKEWFISSFPPYLLLLVQLELVVPVRSLASSRPTLPRLDELPPALLPKLLVLLLRLLRIMGGKKAGASSCSRQCRQRQRRGERLPTTAGERRSRRVCCNMSRICTGGRRKEKDTVKKPYLPPFSPLSTTTVLSVLNVGGTGSLSSIPAATNPHSHPFSLISCPYRIVNTTMANPRVTSAAAKVLAQPTPMRLMRGSMKAEAAAEKTVKRGRGRTRQ
jgi:hypothetical protein